MIAIDKPVIFNKTYAGAPTWSFIDFGGLSKDVGIRNIHAANTLQFAYKDSPGAGEVDELLPGEWFDRKMTLNGIYVHGKSNTDVAVVANITLISK